MNSVYIYEGGTRCNVLKNMAKNKSPFSTICLARSQSADDVRRSRQKVLFCFARFELHEEAILFSWMLSSHT